MEFGITSLLANLWTLTMEITITPNVTSKLWWLAFPKSKQLNLKVINATVRDSYLKACRHLKHQSSFSDTLQARSLPPPNFKFQKLIESTQITQANYFGFRTAIFTKRWQVCVPVIIEVCQEHSCSECEVLLTRVRSSML